MLYDLLTSSEIIIGTLVSLITSIVVLIYLHQRRGRSKYDDILVTLAATSQAPEGSRKNKLDRIKSQSQAEAALHAQTFACSTSSATLIDEASILESVVEKYRKLSKEKNVTTEIIIQKEVVGPLIGKLGNNIRQIQKESNTFICLNESLFEDDDDWVCVIHGNQESVDKARTLVANSIESCCTSKLRNKLVCKEILVPKLCVGSIIGHCGKTIADIKEKSNARVYVDTNRLQVGWDGKECRFVVLKGRKGQIKLAESLILAAVEDCTSLQNPSRMDATGVVPGRSTESPQTEGTVLNYTMTGEWKENRFRLDQKVECFVSCVYHPNLFWIQRIGAESIELRELTQSMTYHYLTVKPWESDEPEANFEVGQIVAAPFFENMYRARIIQLLKDGLVEVEYVDYGDRCTFEINLIRVLEPEFLRTRFQALASSLNLECPDQKWSDETILKFCAMTHCAQWESLTVQFKGFVTEDDGGNEMIERICLELIDCDLNIGEKLVEEGRARRKVEKSNTSAGA